MKRNHSPWLFQLNKDRVHTHLTQDLKTDIAIVGAGIAGISTAFFLLKHTTKKIVLLEHYKLAHGATGHNAGQVTSYFEQGFASLVDKFGLELATKGQKDVEDAWELLDEMYTAANLDIPFSRFLGHAGLSNFDQVSLHLKNNFYRKQGGLNPEQILISEDATFIADIPKEYKNLFTVVSHREILETLETTNKEFIAAISFQKGCINSALFCEKVLLFLLEQYKDRVQLFEHTTIHKVILHQDDALLDAGNHIVKAKKVILCTNGFENLTIINNHGLKIDKEFHHNLSGIVGYMSGYLEEMNKQPIAISYLTNPTSATDEAYFYLTRRYYEYEKGKQHNLISIGGPEANLENTETYSWENEYPEEMTDIIDEFVKNNYELNPNRKIDYIFTWHGLMGYTQNGVRLVGPEPKNPVLMYNLGCNGIGILPSVFGGKKIAEYLTNKVTERSIFDVPQIKP